jgi:hypothetical protein
LGRLKLYIDENVDVRIVEGLRKRGMDTFYAVEESSIGIPDEEQFKHAEKLQAVIFTPLEYPMRKHRDDIQSNFRFFTRGIMPRVKF